MSYILTASTGGGLATPVSIANGGTNSATASDAITALTSIAFNVSAQSADWGVAAVTPPVLPPDINDIADVLDQLIGALTAVGVLG